MSVKKLLGITWDHPRGWEGLEHATAIYLKQHPEVDIQWERHSLRNFEAHPIPELAARYDLLVLDHPFMGDVSASGCLLDLSLYERELALGRLPGNSVGASFESYRYQGAHWALPIDAACQASAYRLDLLGEDFQPPSELRQVRHVASQFRLALGLHSVHSFLILVAIAANIGRLPSDLDLHAPFLTESQGLEALELLRELAAYAPKEALDWNAIDCLNAMSERNDLAYAPYVFSYSSYSGPNHGRGRLSFGRIPSVRGDEPIGSVLGGTGIAVSASCQAVPEAIRFLRYVTSHDTQLLMGLQNGQPALRSVWQDSGLNEAYRGFYVNTLSTLELAYMRPRLAGYMGFQNEGARITGQYLRRELGIRDSLVQLNAAYERVLADRHYDGQF